MQIVLLACVILTLHTVQALAYPETAAPETTAPETTAPETTAPETTAQIMVAQSAPPPNLAGALPRVELRAGMHRIIAEVASTDESRSRGLMFRDKLGPNEGMLFVFRDKAPHCFWMRNTLIPLSIAFLRDDGSVVNMADMKPRTDDSHCAFEPVRYALEMDRGWFASKGITVGSRIGNARYFGMP